MNLFFCRKPTEERRKISTEEEILACILLFYKVYSLNEMYKLNKIKVHIMYHCQDFVLAKIPNRISSYFVHFQQNCQQTMINVITDEICGFQERTIFFARTRFDACIHFQVKLCKKMLLQCYKVYISCCMHNPKKKVASINFTCNIKFSVSQLGSLNSS